jgi:hypothetical protein
MSCEDVLDPLRSGASLSTGRFSRPPTARRYSSRVVEASGGCEPGSFGGNRGTGVLRSAWDPSGVTGTARGAGIAPRSAARAPLIRRLPPLGASERGLHERRRSVPCRACSSWRAGPVAGQRSSPAASGVRGRVRRHPPGQRPWRAGRTRHVAVRPPYFFAAAAPAPGSCAAGLRRECSATVVCLRVAEPTVRPRASIGRVARRFRDAPSAY